MSGQPITAAPRVALPYGLDKAIGAGVTLLENGTDPLDPMSRWRASQGYTLEGDPCTVNWNNTDICDFTPYAPDAQNYPGLYAYQDGFALIVESGVKCSTAGAPLDIAPWHAAADRRLELSQWTQIAYELSYGNQTGAGRPGRFFADGTAIVVGGGAVEPVEAVSLIEDGFANYDGALGGPHLLHVAPRAIAYLKAKNLIVGQGGRWYTALGTLIVCDDGYSMPGPDGSPAGAGTTWMYGTGPITVRLDRDIFHPEPQMVDATQVRTNDIFVRAQRLAAISFLCGLFAVNMTLTDP